MRLLNNDTYRIDGTKEALMNGIVWSVDGGFYLREPDLFIKNADEPGLYTLAEAREKFGRLLIPIRLIKSIRASVNQLRGIQDELEIPSSLSIPTEEDMMRYLGLDNHLLRGGIFRGDVYLEPNPSTGSGYRFRVPEKITKYKVRLLLDRKSIIA